MIRLLIKIASTEKRLSKKIILILMNEKGNTLKIGIKRHSISSSKINHSMIQRVYSNQGSKLNLKPQNQDTK